MAGRFARIGVDADDQYTRNVEASQAFVDRTPAVITDLLNHSNYAWAAQNCKQAAEAHIDLGLLHWRRGIDPRHDFEDAFRACSGLDEMVHKYILSRNDFDLSPVYAAMFLMGHKAQIDYVDEAAVTTSRWACYQYRLVHALHDEAPSNKLMKLTETYFKANEELPDRIFEAYFQLLGLLPTKMDREEQVRRAKTTWAERKRGELCAKGRPLDGHGAMNDLYVDIYLAAILKKIGWTGHTVHAWIWD
jgi:hypothetical protein